MTDLTSWMSVWETKTQISQGYNESKQTERVDVKADLSLLIFHSHIVGYLTWQLISWQYWMATPNKV